MCERAFLGLDVRRGNQAATIPPPSEALFAGGTIAMKIEIEIDDGTMKYFSKQAQQKLQSSADGFVESIRIA